MRPTGIQQHHPDAEPPTASQATGGSGLPGLMEQLTRALLHVPAEPAGPSAPTAPPTELAAEAITDASAVEAGVPTEPPTVETESPAATVTPPAPRRPGAGLGEHAFLDE